MIAVLQRVTRAAVRVDGAVVGAIDDGFLALVGVSGDDAIDDAAILADRVARLRVFEDAAGKMNESLLDRGYSVLAVSQFTLCADLRKGRRPSFDGAARPEVALPLFERFCQDLSSTGIKVETGRFGASMEVDLINRGPATFILDSSTWRPSTRVAKSGNGA